MTRRAVSVGALAGEVAQHLIGCAQPGGAESRPLCLVPNSGVAATLRAEILRRLGGAPCWMPQFIVFHHLESVAATLGERSGALLAACADQAEPDSINDSDVRLRRLLHELLSEKGFFPARSGLQFTDMIAGLFQELTDANISLPESEKELLSELNIASDQIVAHSALSFEATLVAELWAAATSKDDPLLSATAGFIKAAEARQAPVVAVDNGRMTHRISEFLRRTNATVFEPKPGDAAQFLEGLWNPAAEAAEPGEGLVRHFSGYRLVATDSLERAAQAALLEIQQHLSEGRTSIAMIAFDRVLTRRVRALCERENILVDDDTGWIAATILAGATLTECLALATADTPNLDEWADFILAPGTFEGVANMGDKVPAAQALQLLAMEKKAPKLSELEESEEPVLAAAAAEIGALRRHLLGDDAQKRRKPIEWWLARTVELASGKGPGGGILGLFFAQDAVAQRLLRLLKRYADALPDDGSGRAASAVEFRAWLSHILENNTIRPSDIDSTVVITPFERAWLCRFDAAVLLGVDSRTLPSVPSFAVLNSTLRRQLGLEDRDAMIDRQRRQLAAFFECHQHVSAVWGSPNEAGETAVDSPYLSLLAKSLAEAGVDISKKLPAIEPPSAADFAVGAEATVPKDRIPGKIRVSEYDALMACPYRYFGQSMLGLREDRPSAAASYGQAVHRILENFAKARLDERDRGAEAWTREQAEARLHALSEEEFHSDALADRIGLWQWRRTIPKLLDWEEERQAEGWELVGAEIDMSREVEVGEGIKLEVRGKADRIERKSGAESIVDYKTGSSSVSGLTKTDGERPQLGMYAFTREPKTSECVALQCREDFKSHTLNPEEYSKKLSERLVKIFAQISEGVPMPANGVSGVCRHCDISGLCRRDHWGIRPSPDGERR